MGIASPSIHAELQQLSNGLLFQRVDQNAQPPSKGSAQAAGFDLTSSVDIEVKPWARTMVNTGLKVMLPSGTYGRIAPRSG